MSKESEFPKKLAAETGIPALVGDYFSKPEKKRDIGNLHIMIIDLIWEAVQEQGKERFSWADRIAANLGNLYFSHFCTHQYGLSGYANLVTHCYFQQGRHKGTHYFMEKVLFPRALLANEKAIGLLVLFVNLRDNDTGKIAKSHVLNVFQLQPQLGSLIIAKLEKHVDQNTNFLYLAGQVDPVWAFGVCRRWMEIKGKDNNQRNLHAVVVAAGLDLQWDKLALLIKRLEDFWNREQWREDWEVRKAFYAIVQKAFRAGVLDEKAALNYLNGLFEYGFTCDLCGSANALEVLQEVAKDGYVDILYHGFLASASGKKGQKKIQCATDNKQLHNFLESLEEPSKCSFLVGAILNAVDSKFLWFALRELVKFPANEEIRQAFKRALKTKDGDKLFYLGQFYLKLRCDRDYIEFREKWFGLGDFVLDRLKEESEPALIYKIVKPIAYWGSEADVFYSLSFLEEALLAAKEKFQELVMLALACHIRLNKEKARTKEIGQEPTQSSIVMEILSRVYQAREEELLKVVYHIIENEVSDDLIFGNLAFPAIALLSRLKLPAAVAPMAKKTSGKRSGGDMSITINTACAGFLKMMALEGNEEAMSALAKIPVQPTHIWPAPTAILVQIAQETKRDDIRIRAIDLASKRMSYILTGKIHSYVHIEMEAIQPICTEQLVQKRLLDSIDITTDGIGNAICRIPDLILPENRPKAISILKNTLNSISYITGGKPSMREERISLTIIVFEAIHRLEMMVE